MMNSFMRTTANTQELNQRSQVFERYLPPFQRQTQPVSLNQSYEVARTALRLHQAAQQNNRAKSRPVCENRSGKMNSFVMQDLYRQDAQPMTMSFSSLRSTANQLNKSMDHFGFNSNKTLPQTTQQSFQQSNGQKKGTYGGRILRNINSGQIELSKKT